MNTRIGILLTIASLLTISVYGNEKDTLEIKLGESGKIVIQAKDRQAMEKLSKYDINQILNDIVDTVSNADSTIDELVIEETEEAYRQDEDRRGPLVDFDINFKRDQDADEDHLNYRGQDRKSGNRKWRSDSNIGTSINFDLGFNNYLDDGSFPDSNNPESVKTWGSWYVGINHIWNKQIKGILNLEWGAGVSWYNFKLEDEDFRISQGENMILFINSDSLNSIKSKLTASYLNLSLVPMWNFGEVRHSKYQWKRNRGDGFRIGVGGYAGYRIGSHSKYVFREDGDREKRKESDNFFLNNWRYGVRMQMGFRDFDLFINYDLNDLFDGNGGPAGTDLKAISFGIVI